MYEIRIKDNRLGAYRVVKGQTKTDVEAKATAQLTIWEERWNRRVALEKSRSNSQNQRSLRLHGTSQAQALTAEVQLTIQALDSILLDGCNEPALAWADLKERSSFSAPRPAKPAQRSLPIEPSWEHYAPRFTFFDGLIPGKKAKINAKAQEDHKSAVAAWVSDVRALELLIAQDEKEFKALVRAWESEKAEYSTAQATQHAFIDSLENAYRVSDKNAVEYLASEALNRSAFPENFPQGFDLKFDPEARILVVDYELPNPEVLPKHREVKYVASKQELHAIAVTEAWRKGTYDKMLYQMALRIIHRVFSADQSLVIHSVVFNGWVQSVDSATGTEAHGCIVSLQAGRDEFMCLELSRVDPKGCFKSLRGVASSRLIELTPVRPILKLNKDDLRFVEAYSVVQDLDERTNLAAMDWQDFENLIREVFEKEFSFSGGEVKITRASRDGGVDAVAFDPDPLRGGKIVIQAKRYTNTVGVSAVRDLFGTIQHEGAMKGILVTTATFGGDAYEFAKDKPITLISGAELLGILERHGHRAKINLSEARALALSSLDPTSK
jgi:restriction system protein